MPVTSKATSDESGIQTLFFQNVPEAATYYDISRFVRRFDLQISNGNFALFWLFIVSNWFAYSEVPIRFDGPQPERIMASSSEASDFEENLPGCGPSPQRDDVRTPC